MVAGSRKRRMMAQVILRAHFEGMIDELISIAQNTPETEEQSRRVFRQIVTTLVSEVVVQQNHPMVFEGRAITCSPITLPIGAQEQGFDRDVRPRIDEPKGKGKKRGGRGADRDAWTVSEQWLVPDHPGPEGVGKGHGLGRGSGKGREAPWARGGRGRPSSREQRGRDDHQTDRSRTNRRSTGSRHSERDGW